jgi:flagellar motor switch protein FliN/FliY
MTAHATAAEPRTTALALPSLSNAEVALARLIREHAIPSGVGRELARAAHEVIAHLVGPEVRHAVELSCSDERIRLDADAVALDEQPDLGFELVRGRAGVRVVSSGDATLTRNGWIVRPGRAAAVRDGDVVACGGRAFTVRYTPPLPVPYVEVGPARRTDRPARTGFEHAFALEPSGEPVAIECDSSSGRAIVDLLLDGGGERRFDPTAVGDVERAVVAWVAHRFAERACRDLFGTLAAARPVAAGDRDLDVWFAAPVRIGPHCGVWWLGARAAGLSEIAALLEPHARAARAAHPALRRVEVWLRAAARLGRVAVDDHATLAAGDTIVAECAAAREGRYRAEGELDVLGTSGHAVAAELAFGVDSVSARVVGATADPEEKGAFEMSFPTDGEVAQPAFGPVLERLGVTVGVEIARRRMTLGELLALGPGSIVEMDAPIRNSVTLLADGSPFARGELVDADGRLAVRVLALGGRQ